MIKSVSIFGASSATGVHVVDSAIRKGLNVRVLLEGGRGRSPAWGKEVQVVEGALLDIQHVKAALEGQDAAVVLLGSSDEDASGVTCEGLKNILAVMELLHIKAISICPPTRTVAQSTPNFEEVTSQVHSRILRILESTSLHWVIVTAPYVTDDNATGYTIIRERSNIRHTTISRWDLADFLVDCLRMPERYQKTAKIASFAKR